MEGRNAAAEEGQAEKLSPLEMVEKMIDLDKKILEFQESVSDLVLSGIGKSSDYRDIAEYALLAIFTKGRSDCIKDHLEFLENLREAMSE